jgi:integrase
MVANALREWRLACPGELVFPGDYGQPISMRTVVRCWQAAQVAAGITVDGNAKYPGLHALRHFYASWCINRKADGGLELPIKVVQGRLGHAGIQMSRSLRSFIPAQRRQRRAGGRRTRLHDGSVDEPGGQKDYESEQS